MVDFRKRNFLGASVLAGAALAAETMLPSNIRAETKPTNVEHTPINERFNSKHVDIQNVRYKRSPEDKIHERRALTLDLTPLLSSENGFRGQIVIFGYNHITGEEGAAANYLVRKVVSMWDTEITQNVASVHGGSIEIDGNGAKPEKAPSACVFFPITHDVKEAAKQQENLGLQVTELDPDYDSFAVFVLESRSQSSTKLNEHGVFDTIWDIKNEDASGILISNRDGRKMDTGNKDKTLETFEAFYNKWGSTIDTESYPENSATVIN